MMKKPSDLQAISPTRFHFTAILIGLAIYVSLAAPITVWLVSQSQSVTLSFDLIPSDHTHVQVYYDRGRGFNEVELHIANARANDYNRLTFRLPSDIVGLRIDPATSSLDVTIKNLALWTGPRPLSPHSSLECLLPLESIDVLSRTAEALSLHATSSDPQLILNQACLPAVENVVHVYRYLPSFLAFSLLALGVLFAIIYRVPSLPAKVTYSLVGILSFQVVLVSAFSEFNLHPDEQGHTAASAYFQHNTAKKTVHSSEMRAAIIEPWGISYLYLNDVVYSIAERTTRILDIWIHEDFKRYRTFNLVLLFSLLLIFFADRRSGPIFLLALGLSPQIFYIFSYFNGDAFSLFISMLLGLFFVKHFDDIAGYFWATRKAAAKIAIFAFLSVLLTFSRLHYLIFLPFLFGLILLNKPKTAPLHQVGRTFIRLVSLFLVILIPVGLATLHSHAINGFERTERIASLKEELADPSLTKAGIRASRSNPHLMWLRDFGVPLTHLLSRKPVYAGEFDQPRLVQYDWLGRKLDWSFGVYGYGTFVSPRHFVTLSSMMALGSVLLILAIRIFRCDLQYRLSVGFFILFLLLVLLQSLIFSWTYGFQPQGRYLFALIPMLAVTMAMREHRLSSHLVFMILAVVYLVSASGFWFYGAQPMIASSF
jgi:hypothetical protein